MPWIYGRFPPDHTVSLIRRGGHPVLIIMPFLPVAQFTVAGVPFAFVLGGVTILALVATAVLGMLVLREGSNVKFSWHVNMARLTIVIAVIHGLVVYWTFF
jgi:hypothetical protein